MKVKKNKGPSKDPFGDHNRNTVGKKLKSSIFVI